MGTADPRTSRHRIGGTFQKFIGEFLRRRCFIMKTDESDCARFLKVFSVGSFLGALAGILFAPKSGKGLRPNLKQIGSDIIDKTMQLSSEVR
jgi:hypothetical protein